MPRKRQMRNSRKRFLSHAPQPEPGVFLLHAGRMTCGRHLWVKVDTEDAARLMRYEWTHQNQYPLVYIVGKNVPASMPQRLHRFILNAADGTIVDHINGDPLDNRKQNLRFVTAQQNAMNSRVSASATKTSEFKGVSRSGEKWSASITKGGKSRYLGTFETQELAAAAYDAAALALFGEYARTNAMMGLFEGNRHVFGSGPIWAT